MTQKLVSSGQVQVSVNWDWENQLLSGINYKDTFGFSHTDPSQGNGTSSGGTVAGVCDLKYNAQLVIAGAGNTTFDLTALTDTVFGGAINLVRVKLFFFELPISVTPQASSITVGAAASNPWLGWLGGTAPTFLVNKGMLVYVGFDPGAVGFITSGTSKVVKILNNDGTNSATVNVGFIGNST
jgi:hypothetical protein